MTTKLTFPFAIALHAGLTAAAASAADRSGEKVEARLTKVEETRRVELVADRDENSPFDFDSPRLELRFALEAPVGTTVSRIDQPSRIKAVDSTGKELTDVKKGFGNEKQFLSLVNVWGESAKEFTLKLSLPARGAKAFSVDAVFDVWVHEGIEEVSFEPTSEPAEITVPSVGSQRVSARLEEVRGFAQLTFTPATIKPYIESIEFTDGKDKVESHGAMWDDRAVTYLFQGMPAPGMKAKVKVRSGLRSIPCRIKLTDQTLP